MKTTVTRSVLLFFMLFFLSPGNINAQDNKLTRKEQKEVRKAQMEASFYMLDSLLNQRSFVLKADYLRNKDGVNIPVLPNLNFIMVDKQEGVLQTGSNTATGSNGFGGTTAQGRIESWEISGNKKSLTYTLHFSLLSNLGNFDILMFVGADHHANATITGLTPGRLTWSGYIESIKNSNIFKGQQTF